MLLSAGAPTLCPTSWLQNEEVTQRLEKEIRAWYASMDEERALIAAWEAHDGEDRSFRAFTRFAIRHVAPSLGKDPEELLLPQRRQHLGDPVVVED
jgi:hypothetical protein